MTTLQSTMYHLHMSGFYQTKSETQRCKLTYDKDKHQLATKFLTLFHYCLKNYTANPDTCDTHASSCTYGNNRPRILITVVSTCSSYKGWINTYSHS